MNAPKLTRSEALFLQHLRAYDFPEPELQHRFDTVRRWKFDFAWPATWLAVEIDGQVHAIRGKRQADTEKANEAMLRGWRVLRFTSEQVISAQAIDTMRDERVRYWLTDCENKYEDERCLTGSRKD